MPLDRKLFQEIVAFLTPYYGFENESARRATLLNAGLSELLPLLDINAGKQAQFVPLLIERLEQHGMVDGVPALVLLLQAIKPTLGQDKRETLERFCHLILQPPSQTPNIPIVVPKQKGESASTLKAYFSDLSGGQRFFAFSLTLFVIEILLWRWDGSFAQTLILSCLFPLIIRMTQVAWLPEGYDRPKLRQILSGVVLIAAAGFSFWNEWLWNFVGSRLFHDVPFALPKAFPAMIALGLLLFGFFLIHALVLRDASAMKTHPTPLEKEFPEKGYKRRLEAFCGVLLDDLNKIDRETNWSAEYFTPLDAEVEMQSGNKRLKKVTDLLTAIRSDRKSKVFLVLGDPGSGKSVALRKLCRDLLKEMEKTGKVPLYINLREWAIEAAWTETDPPTVQQLYDFVLRNLKERGDVFANDFLDRYFYAMFDHGRLFLVLDSFDEIPAVMDTDTSSWLIDKLSDVIYKFLAGANESRGILASRIFRKPTHNFQAQTTLEIRPFTEAKIIETFQKSLLHESETLTRLLFKERLEFVPIARNPFTAALLVSYAKEHQNTLPATQAELYADYIVRRLRMCQDRMKKLRLTEDGLIRRATDIAYLMFTTPECGLDVPLATLAQHFEGALQDELTILTYGRLGRMGAGDEHRFSFAHRRFQEYFVAKRLLENPDGLTLDAIPTDSRWRDALVIYCEVAPEAEARKIAEFCWSEISQIHEENLNMSDPQYLRAIHSLRFLKDAFHSRHDYLVSFQDDLADFVERQIESGNLLAVKLAAETVGILKEDRLDSAIIKALSFGNSWVSETCLKACRHLPQISDELQSKLQQYLDTIKTEEFFKRRNELLFSLGLSDGFTYLHWLYNIKSLNIKAYIGGLICFFIANPIFLFFITFLIADDFVSLPPKWTRKIQRFLPRFLPRNAKVIYFSIRSLLGIFFMFVVIFLSGTILYGIILSPSAFKDMVEISSDEHILKIFPLGFVIYHYYKINILYIIIFMSYLGMALLTPWYQIISIYSLLRKSNWKNRIGFFIKLIISLCLISILPFIIKALKPLVIKLLEPQEVRIILSPLILIIFYSSILWYGYLCLQDYLFLKKTFKISNVSRNEIAMHFKCFRTSRFRLKYIRFLLKNKATIEGNWPDGKIPNIKNDEASTLLAQLEERWLGLDR